MGNATEEDIITNVTKDSNVTDGADVDLFNRDLDLAKVEVGVTGAIFVLALFSNSLVIVALVRQLRRKPSSRMYRLMFHLSVADLLVAIFNVLPQLIWDITHRLVDIMYITILNTRQS